MVSLEARKFLSLEELFLEDLCESMKKMFDQKPRKLELRKQFEMRLWKNNETFKEYMYEKVIMGNRVSIGNDEVIDYIIEGISELYEKSGPNAEFQRSRRNFASVREGHTAPLRCAW